MTELVKQRMENTIIKLRMMGARAIEINEWAVSYNINDLYGFVNIENGLTVPPTHKSILILDHFICFDGETKAEIYVRTSKSNKVSRFKRITLNPPFYANWEILILNSYTNLDKLYIINYAGKILKLDEIPNQVSAKQTPSGYEICDSTMGYNKYNKMEMRYTPIVKITKDLEIIED